MPAILRDYQTAAADALLSAWESGAGHALIVLPTGSGKSLVAAEVMRRLVQDHGARVLLATHVAELIEQNARSLVSLWPEAPFGIFHAGLNKRDGGAPICLAGIHSIFRQPAVVGERHVLLIDEAHLLSHKDAGMYRALIRDLEAAVPGMRVGGLTATPYRMSSGRLDEDYGEHKALFSDVVYEVTIVDLIRDGYLCPVLPYVSPERVSTAGVKTSAGDYNQKQLQEAVDRDSINERVVDEICRAGEERKTWLVFASGVEHCKHLVDLLRGRGVEAEYVIGDTEESVRKEIFSRARDGSLRCIVGVGVITTGLDIPGVDLIACVRPTRSKGLWTQLVGRGTRLSPDTGKANCLLLDFTENSLTHGPIDMLNGSKARGAGGEAPVRECPDCHLVHHAAAKNCPACGHSYPEGEIRISALSRAAPILSTQTEAVWHNVDTLRASRHRKPGSPDSLRLDFVCGLRVVSKWLALDHPGASGMARRWWEQHSYSGVAPRCVDEALERVGDIRAPGRVCVTREGRFDRIVGFDNSISPGRGTPVELAFTRRRNEQQPENQK